MGNIYSSAEFFKAVYNHKKITYSWCFKEINERHPGMCYTKEIEFKEGKDLDHGNSKVSSSGRGSKMYQTYWI